VVIATVTVTAMTIGMAVIPVAPIWPTVVSVVISADDYGGRRCINDWRRRDIYRLRRRHVNRRGRRLIHRICRHSDTNPD
jgi:hypothetical protein